MMHDPRTVAALIETVHNQVSERETGCLSMLGERVLVAEIERLRRIENALQAIMEAHGPGTLASDELFAHAVEALEDR